MLYLFTIVIASKKVINVTVRTRYKKVKECNVVKKVLLEQCLEVSRFLFQKGKSILN